MLSIILIVISITSFYFLSKARKGVSLSLLLVSFSYHFIFIHLYYFLFLESGSDAKNFYFNNALIGNTNFSIGGQFIVYLIHFPVKYLNATFYEISIAFGTIGYFGLLINYISIKNYIINLSAPTNKVILLLLFLPGLNFWTAAPGKDSLIFFFISIFFYSLLNSRTKLFTLLTSVVFIFLIRPQIGAIFIFSLIATLFFQKKIKISVKISALFFLLSMAFLTAPYILKYIGLSEISTSSIIDYINLRAGYNVNGGSSIDISQSNILTRVSGYLFRPLFFDIKDILGLVASLENTIYLLIFLYLTLNTKYYTHLIKRSTFTEKFLAIYFSSMAIALASITANLGIALRQKTMFITTLLFVYVIYKSHVKKRQRLWKSDDI